MSEEVLRKLDEIKSMLSALLDGKSGNAGASGKAGQVADDKLFHGQYGNPEAFTDPKDWDGASMKGTRFSDCPIAWLESAADMYDRFGAKAEKEGRVNKTSGKPDAWRDFQKAALCRRWAQEKRKNPAADAALDDGGDLPF